MMSFDIQYFLVKNHQDRYAATQLSHQPLHIYKIYICAVVGVIIE